MGTPRSPMWIGFCAIVLLLVAASCSSSATPTATLVVGSTECLDCSQKNIKSENAAKGLRVVIKCKVSNEKYETKSVGVVDADGNFNVELPSDLLQTNGELKQECFTQLHSAPNAPCPDKNGLTSPSNKLILKSKGIFAASGKLFFSSANCVSATFWHKDDPWHKYHKDDPWHKDDLWHKYPKDEPWHKDPKDDLWHKDDPWHKYPKDDHWHKDDLWHKDPKDDHWHKDPKDDLWHKDDPWHKYPKDDHWHKDDLWHKYPKDNLWHKDDPWHK